jgi:iron complex outermembrane receptor protein
MNAPEHTANGWLYYTLDKTPLKGFSVGVGTYYVGERPSNEYSLRPDGHGTPVGVKPFDMPAYTTTNVQLAYPAGRFTVRAFINNLFDNVGYNAYFRGGFINQTDPRNISCVLSYQF